MADEIENDPWPNFQVPLEEEDAPTISSVAVAVLETFDIDTESKAGGKLRNVDLKRVDALSALKASLLDEFAQNGSGLREVTITHEGKAKFYTVGYSSSNLNAYYSLKSSAYLKPEVGVMITGGKPRQERVDHPWFPMVGPEANSTVHDTSLITTNCAINQVSTHAVVTYEDPIRHSGKQNWNNGVKDLLEIDNPFQRIVGFSWRIIPPPEFVSHFTTIKKQSQSSVPVLLAGGGYTIGGKDNIPNIGTPIKRKRVLHNDDEEGECTAFDSEIHYCSDTSIELDMESIMKEGITYESYRGTKINKFVSVQGLFCLGIPLGACYGTAKDEKQLEDPSTENTDLFVAAPDMNRDICKLREGIDYITLYDEDALTPEDTASLPCFQLANNLKYNDKATIGTNIPFFIDNYSVELRAAYEKVGKEDQGIGSIIARDGGSGGILVEQLWVQILLDTPCFQVVDPLNNAGKIARGLLVDIKPLSVIDNPAPIAVNGVLVDQFAVQQDNNPTTTQDFEKSPLALAQIEASKGRTLSLTLGSLDEDGAVTLSEQFYSMMLQDDGVTYSHTCPADSEPELGSRGPNGKVINEIEYSYTDENNYLINVMEGPIFYGDFAGMSGGIYYKRTEDISSKGMITQDVGNNVNYLVHVDGYGEVYCINGSGSVITIGDRVSVTIHNNPVES